MRFLRRGHRLASAFPLPQRREMGGLAVGMLLVATMLSLSPNGPAATASSSELQAAVAARPNVVLIVMDDMRKDDAAWMPRVQRWIAGRGTTFDRFYTPTSLCCPARSSILRGQYPHNTGVLTNAEPDGGYAGFTRLQNSTLATWLQDSYATGYVGKYFNGYESPTQTLVPAGWDDWQATVSTYGYLGIKTNDNGSIIDWSGRNSPGVFGIQANQFLAKQIPAVDPFFLHLSFVTPHTGGPRRDGDGGVATPFVQLRDRGTYDGPSHATDASYNEADVSDKVGPVAGHPPLTRQERRDIAVKMQQRRESLAAADRAVGQVLATLRRSEEADNTYVMFTSDNGYLLGEHRIFEGKRQPYEQASRMPFYISGPGVPVGGRWTGVAGTHDIAPTILEIAGLAAPYPLDGVSVLPTTLEPDGGHGRAVLLEGARRPVDAENGGAITYAAPRSVADTDWYYRGIVTKRWKLIHWPQYGGYELYDLRGDPFELQNVYEARGYQQPSRQLQRRLRSLWLCRGDACVD